MKKHDLQLVHAITVYFRLVANWSEELLVYSEAIMLIITLFGSILIVKVGMVIMILAKVEWSPFHWRFLLQWAWLYKIPELGYLVYQLNGRRIVDLHYRQVFNLVGLALPSIF